MSGANLFRGFFSWDWMRSEVYKTKLDTPDETLALILDASVSTKKREE
jgi:hypothetical protein